MTHSDLQGNSLALALQTGVSPKRVESVQVLPDSPGEEGGLEVGDRIIRIDGRPAGEFERWELDGLMRQAGRTVVLDYRRGDASSVLRITLRPLI